MPQDPLAVAIAATDSGLCHYMKLPDGSIIAEYNTVTNAQVKTAQDQDDKAAMLETQPWYRSSNIFGKSDSFGDLAVYAWGNKVAVFHQYDQKLAYWIHEPFNTQTSCTDGNRIQLPDPQDESMQCKPGTRLAITGDSSAKTITIFYQDKDGYLCCRLAQSFVWSEPVRLPTESTAAGTGIAAISWGVAKNKQIRVYYQDKSFGIKECCCSGGDTNIWSNGIADFSGPTGLTDIGVTQWSGDNKNQIRVYYQVGPSGIHQSNWTSGMHWYGDFVCFDAFISPFNILAFCRGDGANPVVNVWIVSKNSRVLLQQAYTPADSWIGPVGQALPRTDYTA